MEKDMDSRTGYYRVGGRSVRIGDAAPAPESRLGGVVAYGYSDGKPRAYGANVSVSEGVNPSRSRAYPIDGGDSTREHNSLMFTSDDEYHWGQRIVTIVVSVTLCVTGYMSLLISAFS